MLRLGGSSNGIITCVGYSLTYNSDGCYGNKNPSTLMRRAWLTVATLSPARGLVSGAENGSSAWRMQWQ